MNPKSKDIVYFAAKDCHRKDIWRNSIYSKYKENRIQDDAFLGGPLFETAYKILEHKHPTINIGINIQILYHPKLEADDCIAITTNYLLSNNNSNATNNVIYIIASDMDYLQLAGPTVHIINLKYKLLTDNKKWSGDPDKDLFCKIVMGDKSDNIPGIFKGCGPKTATKYYNKPEHFVIKLVTTNTKDAYERNKTLVDFTNIPSEYQHKLLYLVEPTSIS